MKKRLLTTLTITAAMTFSLTACGMNNTVTQESEVAGAYRDEVALCKSYEMPQKINIDAGVYDLHVEASKDGNAEIDYVGPEKYIPIIKYDQDDKIMKINQASTEVENKAPEQHFKCDLTIKVPREELEKFGVKLGVGGITIEELSAKDIDIDTGTGDVNIREIEGDQIDITSAVGEIAVYNATFEDIRLNAAIGDVTLETEKSALDYDVQIKTGLGNTYVEDKPVTAEFNSQGTRGSITIVDELGSVNLYSEHTGGQGSTLGAFGFWSNLRDEG